MPIFFRLLTAILLTMAVTLSAAMAADKSIAEKELLTDKRSRLSDILLRIEKKYQDHELKQNKIKQTAQAKFAVNNRKPSPLSNTRKIETQSVLNNAQVDEYGYQISPETGIPEGQDLILSIYIDKLYLADVFAYKSSSGAKISLDSFFEIVDFPIQIDHTQKIATGWFINEGNQFVLDFSETEAKKDRIQLTINGQSSILQSSEFIIEDDEIYVDGDLLSSWFGLNLGYNFTDLLVKLNPSQPLPIQSRLARESRVVNTSNKNVSVMPWKESNYQMLSSPLVDVQLQTSTNNNDNNFSAYSMLGSHDLAFMNVDYFIAGDTIKELNHSRIKLSKYSASGNLFGFLPATNFEVGDIQPVSIGSNFNTPNYNSPYAQSPPQSEFDFFKNMVSGGMPTQVPTSSFGKFFNGIFT